MVPFFLVSRPSTVFPFLSILSIDVRIPRSCFYPFFLLSWIEYLYHRVVAMRIGAAASEDLFFSPSSSTSFAFGYQTHFSSFLYKLASIWIPFWLIQKCTPDDSPWKYFLSALLFLYSTFLWADLSWRMIRRDFFVTRDDDGCRHCLL